MLRPLLALALFTACSSLAAELSVGDVAPNFSAVADDGTTWTAANHVGKKIIVVYFYPADMTGGCTKQACAFRDDQAALAAKDVIVVGVSGDSVRNHTLFKKVHSLNFPLLADEDGAVAKAFGVPVRKGGSIERTIDEKLETLTRGVSASRWTFVVGKDGKIAHKNTKVKAAEDSKSVLAVVETLK